MEQPSPQTKVDPKGLALLYLAKDEIPRFFDSMVQHFRAKKRRAYWIGLPPLILSLVFGAFSCIRLMAEIEEDEDPFIFFACLVVAIVAGLILARGVSGNRRLEAKGLMLKSFFDTIADDIHPQAVLKGQLDHRNQRKEHIYKTKTSPYSGARKEYFKYRWAKFKFTLLDGSFVRLVLLDKLKTKSGSIVRFAEIQRGQLQPNELLYKSGALQHYRSIIAESEPNPVKAVAMGYALASGCKKTLRPLGQVRTAPPKDSERPAAPAPAAVAKPKHIQCLQASSLPQLRYEMLAGGVRVAYAPAADQAPVFLDLIHHPGPEAWLELKMPVSGQAAEPERLLRANPALAYGRFALDGGEAVVLVKSLLYETLDIEELDTAISGLARLGASLAQLEAPPPKARRYRTGQRDPAEERKMLQKALRGLNAQLDESEKKFKVTVPLPDGRSHRVHVRFDRQDADGHQLISILAWCGEADPAKYQACLQENLILSYGAVGLARLGQQDMFVVSDTQLAETADPAELKAAILHIAHKGDQLEKQLSGQDIY